MANDKAAKMQKELINAAQALKLASSWVERNEGTASDLHEQLNDMLLDLGRGANSVSFSVSNLQHRPCIGLFGASQAGKSYLVSTLAAGNSGTLSTHWDEHAVDFIRHVNPSGNNSEATGFATRFTHALSHAPQGFPIELKLLSELELAMILINAFFNDINQTDVTVSSDENFYLKHLDSLESLVDKDARAKFNAYPADLLQEINNSAANGAAAANAAAAGGAAGSASSVLDCSNLKVRNVNVGRQVTVGGVTEFNYIQPEQVIELADYVAANSNGKLGSFNTMPNVWMKLRSMLPFMTLDGRIKALSIFWQQLPIFTQTYLCLASELLKVKGHQVIYAPISAFVTVKGDGLEQNATGTIMHITKLGTMFTDKDELQCALTVPAAMFDAAEAAASASASGAAGGRYDVSEVVAINASRLAALSLELCFRLENSGPLDELDVLDLPGARSRDVVLLKDVVDDGATFAKDGKLTEAICMRGSEFFRRGKVSYIFERYARRTEIDQLLFCIGVNAQQDVTSVLTILSDWVDKNVGNTPQRRATGYNPLTIVLTRYDEVFNRQLRNISNGLPIDMNQEVNIALNRIVKLNWFNEWTPNKPFDRVLMARKPNLGELNPWLDFDPATKQELGIKDADKEGIARIKEELLKVSGFVEHVHDLEKVIDSVLTLNDGGVSNISNIIRENSLKESERVSVRTNKSRLALQSCISKLSPFATRDSALALEKAKAESKEVSLGLLQCNAIAPCFDLIRGLLEISETRLEEIYQQGFSTGSNVQRFVQTVCAEFLDNLAELWRKDNQQLNKIADLVVKGYLKVLPNLEADPSNRQLFSMFFNDGEGRFKTAEEAKESILTVFIRLFNEIAKTFSSPQVGLKNYMVQVLLDAENINEGFGDIVRGQVQLMSFILADFNLYLGANLLPTAADKAAMEAELKSAPAAAPAAPAAAPSAAPAASAAGGFGGASFKAPAFGDEEDDFSDLAFGDEDDGYSPVGANAPKPVAPSAPVLNVPLQNVAPSKSAAAAALKGGVLGSESGPVNCFSIEHGRVSYDERKQDRTVFTATCDADDTGVLPHLNERSAAFEFKLISDYASTLMYMMCQVNVLSESKYQFSSEENLLLCRILGTMESFE